MSHAPTRKIVGQLLDKNVQQMSNNVQQMSNKCPTNVQQKSNNFNVGTSMFLQHLSTRARSRIRTRKQNRRPEPGSGASEAATMAAHADEGSGNRARRKSPPPGARPDVAVARGARLSLMPASQCRPSRKRVGRCPSREVIRVEIYCPRSTGETPATRVWAESTAQKQRETFYCDFVAWPL